MRPATGSLKNLLSRLLAVAFATLFVTCICQPVDAGAKRLTNRQPRFTSPPAHAPLPAELRATASSVATTSSADTFHLAWYDFNPGGNPSTQGWVAVDRTAQLDTFFHVAGPDELDGGTFGALLPLEGNQSMWCGVDASSSPPYCGYAALPGYGNNWEQVLESKLLACDSVRICYKVFFDSEWGYDQTRVQYWDNPNWIDLPVNSGLGFYTGTDNLFECFTFTVTGDTTQIRFFFESDEAFSDEDGLWTFDGAIVVDSITVLCFQSGVLQDSLYEDFEDEAPGAHVTNDGCWQARTLEPFGTLAALYPGLVVLQQDPCITNTSFLWGFFVDPSINNYWCHQPDPHPEQGTFPQEKSKFVDGRMVYANNEIWSPRISLTGSGTEFRLKFDVYRDMPLDNLHFFAYRVRSWTGGCPGPWNFNSFLGFGGDGEWLAVDIDISTQVDNAADEIQIALGAVDGCPLFPSSCALAVFRCRSHAPLFDDVHVERIDSNGPRFSVRHIDLFQDNFPDDGTITGTARADAANDINSLSHPSILPGDSINVLVDDPISGLAGDPLSGTGPAVYVYIANLGSGGRTLSPKVEAPETRAGVGLRYPLVDSLLRDGTTWYCFRMDSALNTYGDPLPDAFCFDLNDTFLKPGNVVGYVFCAENTTGEKNYWSRRLNGQGDDFVTSDLWEALTSPCEFSILPGEGWANGGDILYVDDTDDRGGPVQLYFDWTFYWLAINNKVDRYDVLGPSSSAGNSLASRVKNVPAQIMNCYKKIIWSTGNLSSGLIGDGGFAKGGTGPEKSDDFDLLFEFLDTRVGGAGLYIDGDDVAEYWRNQVGASAIATRQTFMDFDLAGTTPGDHIASGEPVSPLLHGVGPCFVHLGVPDSLIVYGGCPLLNQFDLLIPNGSAAVEFVNPNSGHAYVISQATQNAVGDTARVILSGFSTHIIAAEQLGFRFARDEYIYDIIRWLGNTLPNPTAVPDEPVVGRNVLEVNYPNPFNPTTTIRYNVRERGHVTLSVYNVAGQRVRTLVDDVRDPVQGGLHTVVWHGDSEAGQEVASGVYFYKLVTPGFTKTRKMVLLK